MPTLRMKAFLRCLREYECQAERDDAKRYQMLNTPLPNGDKRFTNFSKHPWYGVMDHLPNKGSSAAGAYQITSETWRDLLKIVEPHLSNIQDMATFTPLMQDRLAVAIFEFQKAISSIRQGEIDTAVSKLNGRWSSLPGGKHNLNRKTPDGKPMDMNYFTALFNTYLNEEMKKEILA